MKHRTTIKASRPRPTRPAKECDFCGAAGDKLQGCDQCGCDCCPDCQAAAADLTDGCRVCSSQPMPQAKLPTWSEDDRKAWAGHE